MSVYLTETRMVVVWIVCKTKKGPEKVFIKPLEVPTNVRVEPINRRRVMVKPLESLQGKSNDLNRSRNTHPPFRGESTRGILRQRTDIRLDKGP